MIVVSYPRVVKPKEGQMLVLDRKVQEGFWIDGRIFVKVLGIGRKRVKLGIEAPDDVKIIREELRARLGANATPAQEEPTN